MTMMTSAIEQLQQHCNLMLQQRTESLSCADRLQQAMQYSLLSPGKRLRAALVYATGACLGLNITALDDLAAAIEAVHAYSLIHDDLPAMDDDDTRRGQPSCHRKFGEATAILAGDALHSQAMQWITDSQHLNCNQKLNALRILTIYLSPEFKNYSKINIH